MVFKKIETKRKSLYAAEQLIQAIRSGIYKVGDRLPTERELAKQMGISRPLIREALSALHLAGIIESRAGDGTYIRRTIDGTDIESQVLFLLEQSEDPAEILEAREVIEVGLVKLAAKKATPEDLQRIEAALQQLEEAVITRDYASFVKADLDFHLAIVAASQNRLLEAAARSIIEARAQKLWEGLDKLYLLSKSAASQTVEEHKRIFKAIEQRAPSLASKEMARHLKKTRGRVLGRH
ncbi:FadR family transcriptional regulator [Candidatus Bipolaricaulota bacterium]|nr:FadR family transcriptional regulator [Candidatus Bipolaricaulota bacterium]